MPEVSLPVRGAWIEIVFNRRDARPAVRRSPCGERGLKCKGVTALSSMVSRSPCGERGLKSHNRRLSPLSVTVAPRAGSVD